MSLLNFKSQLVVCDQFPSDNFQRDRDLLIIDKNILRHQPAISDGWSFVYAVEGGENLKDISEFSSHVAAILSLWKTPVSRSSRIVACGGGSVGDFAGFFASVLKRGVKLEQCPSTWLAAIDSSHGGKTAMNVGGIKNQIGTFYPAQKVYLVKNILLELPGERAHEALGELVKISLLDKTNFFSQLTHGDSQNVKDLLWSHVLRAVSLKYDIVLLDPYETQGLRKILNLGHTWGHVLESVCGLSHGESVSQGLWFALDWSLHRGVLSLQDWEKIQTGFVKLGLKKELNRKMQKPLSVISAKTCLAQDKKMNEQDKIDFVFLKEVGVPVVEAVTVAEIISEAQRQGWVDGGL